MCGLTARKLNIRAVRRHHALKQEDHERHLVAFCGKMLNQGAEWLFKAQPANRKRPTAAITAPTITATDGGSSSNSSSSSNEAIPPKPMRSRRTWQTPYTAVQLYKDLLSGNFKKGRRTCCKKMRCVECFATGEYDNELLIREQERMAKFVLETERKQFVQERCPLGPLQRGAMYAGLKPVCSNAFVWLFGVSTDLIAAVKGTPKARASSTIGRQVVGDVTAKFESKQTHNLLKKGHFIDLSCFVLVCLMTQTSWC